MLDTERVRHLRIAKRLTTKEAAWKAKFGSTKEWARLEGPEEINVNLSTLYRVANVLGCSPASLLKKGGK